jgi:hypothetical protein
MRKFLSALSIGILAVLAVQSSSWAQGAANPKPKAPDAQFVVLSPWADVDPITVRGISPRLQSLAGKKIGIFVNPKRAAMPIAESIIRRLGAMYADAQTIVFRDTEANVNVIETKNKDRFIAWAKQIDAAIAVVGD